MNEYPKDAHTYRVTRHAIQKCIERGFANTAEEAIALIREALRNPECTYRSHRHPSQFKVHAKNGLIALAVDVINRSVPTIFVSGAAKLRGEA